jgi:tripartite-type tricarboxylate transporter receptor subunit TctC
VNSVKELVEYLKKNPDKATFASSGSGSSDHLTAELFWQQTGTTAIHVPYKGGAPAIQDVIAGQIDMFFANVSEIVGQIRSGQVRALGLAAAQPNPMAPDLPLMTRDIPTLEINNWFGLVGPAGLPADIASGLTRLFLEAIADPSSKPVLDSRGLIAVPQDGPAFKAQIMKDRERWATVVKAGNIKAE